MVLKDFFKSKLVETNNMTISMNDILIVIIILVATWTFLWIIKRLLKRQSKRKELDIGKGSAIFQIIKYILWVIAIIISLETVGVKVTILLASSAALLVGLGLGIQKIFMDIVSGVAILFERTIKVYDIVELENGLIGKVEEITLRTSKIRTRDNIILIVPNSKFINENVINWSHMDMKTRFNVSIGVAYGSDVKMVKQILIDCAKDHPEVAKNPTPIVQFRDFGDSSLAFKLFFWTDNSFFVENIKSDLRYAINEKFKENQVVIPFPQRDVHMKKN